MQTKNEIIASLVPHIISGILADETGGDGQFSYGEIDPHENIATRAFDLAEALHAEGVKRGVYPNDEPAPAQVPADEDKAEG